MTNRSNGHGKPFRDSRQLFNLLCRSRYSKGSSRYGETHASEAEEKREQERIRRKAQKEREREEAKKAKKLGPAFDEFMQVMKPRDQVKHWGNDDANPNQDAKLSEKIKMGGGQEMYPWIQLKKSSGHPTLMMTMMTRWLLKLKKKLASLKEKPAV